VATPNLVATDRATLVLGPRHVLNDVSLGISSGDRIGLVGANGSGKTTLMRVLAGILPVDSGRVTHTSGLTVGLLDQTDAVSTESVRDVVLGAMPEHQWAADWRIRDVLDGLLGGLNASGVGGWDTRVDTLSGGEQRRISLAKLLVADPDLLLLDEPTNHLDVEGIAWLAGYLARRRNQAGTATLTATHDRWFLDATSTLTWEITGGQVISYEGGYAAYVLAKAERERIATITEQRRANLLRKELAWLRRGPPARTSKPKFRIEAANALIADEPEPRDAVTLVRFANRRLGKDVLDLIDATIQLNGRILFDHQTWRLAPGDRVGIVGANGSGKTTLLRALLGQVRLTAGKLKTGRTVVARILSQDLAELDDVAGLSVIDAITEVRRVIVLDGKEVSASSLARRLGFTGARQQSRVEMLSGGERRRLQLLRLLMAEPNVLMLDEPTNDLDIETLTAIEDVLDGWAGTLLVVSHDRYLLERITDRQVGLLGDGTIRDLPGGVDEYLQLRKRMRAERADADEAERARDTAGIDAGESSARPSSAEQRQARKDVARLERALARLAEREARLHEEMTEFASDHERILALDAELRSLHAEREQLEEEWLIAAEIAE
jgi:ATP-binding cassette subfamily F protein uup